MNLVVLSSHSLKQMEKWVTKMFSPIANKYVKLPDLSNPQPFNPERLGVLSKFHPVKDKHTLEIVWVLPYCELEFRSKPIKYFSHLFGDESEHSLLGFLKAEGLAMSLTSDYVHEIGAFSYLCVTIVLT
jgi:insulysin